MKSETTYVSLSLLAIALGALTGLTVAVSATSTNELRVYWHATNDGLPTLDVEALATAPLSPTVLYAGTWGDGVFRSIDGGATWDPANTGITLPLYVEGVLAVNPVSPTILFTGDYYGDGIYRSTDGGETWARTLTSVSASAVAVHPLTPTLVLAGDREAGLYRSVDSGATWIPITATAGLSSTKIAALAIASEPPGTIYAGAEEYISASHDGGLTWTGSGTLPSRVQSLAVHPLTPTLIYAGTYSQGAYRSLDGGGSWQPINEGLPAYAWVTSLAIAPITPTVLYAGLWNGQVYRSFDDGDTWEGLGYLGNVYAVLVHPTAPSVIYAGTSNNGVFRGSTLHHLTIEPVHSPQYAYHPFSIALAACDELGFPLTGLTPSQVEIWTQRDPALAQTLAAGGFDGIAILTDTTATLNPSQIEFVDGLAAGSVRILKKATADQITAWVADGPTVTSNPFDVIWTAKIYLPMIVRNR